MMLVIVSERPAIASTCRLAAPDVRMYRPSSMNRGRVPFVFDVSAVVLDVPPAAADHVVAAEPSSSVRVAEAPDSGLPVLSTRYPHACVAISTRAISKPPPRPCRG